MMCHDSVPFVGPTVSYMGEGGGGAAKDHDYQLG